MLYVYLTCILNKRKESTCFGKNEAKFKEKICYYIKFANSLPERPEKMRSISSRSFPLAKNGRVVTIAISLLQCLSFLTL